MTKSLILPAAALLGALLFATPSFAATDDMDTQQITGTTASGIPIASGGIGEEMDYLKSVESHYNLKLLFTEGNGDYLSDIPVHIHDKAGRTVADTVTKGPVLLVLLPPGTYKVTADKEGAVKTQTVSVTKAGARKLHEFQFRFPTVDVTPGM